MAPLWIKHGKLLVKDPVIVTPPVEPPPPTSTNFYNKLFGFASYNGTVTGGAGGTVTTVTTYDQFKSACLSTTPMTIYVSGTINGSSSNYGFYSKGNKTIYGLPGSVCNGFGIWFDAATNANNGAATTSNIIIRNLKFQNMMSTDSLRDYITIKEGVTRVYISHCEFYANANNDGMLDFGTACDFGTFAYNRFFNASRCTICGGSNQNPLDFGKLRATYAFNYFQDNSERCPSYFTSTGCHVMNNYYKYVTRNTTSNWQVAARAGGIVCVERNYFEDVTAHPLAVIAGTTTGGDPVPYGKFSMISSNIFDNCGTNQISNMGAESTWYPPYTLASGILLAASDVPAHVAAYSGQKLTQGQLALQP